MEITMKAISRLYTTKKKGFSLLEFILSLALLTLLITCFMGIQHTVAKDYGIDRDLCEQIMQMNTALDCFKEVAYMAYAAEIKPSTLVDSKKAVFYVKDELNLTHVYCFYLNRYTGILYESIQGTSSPGTIQLAVEVGDLDFLWINPLQKNVIAITIAGKAAQSAKIQRYFYLRNLQ